MALERGLAAELTDHQGFWEEPGRLRRRVPTRGTGPRPRPLTSEVGPFETGGRPRCRAGSFTPRRVAQGGQCRPGRPGFDDHQLVRRGMMVRESATAWRSRSGRPLSGDGTVPEDHRRPGPSSQRTARGPRRGPSFPVIHPRARSAPTAPRRPPGRPDRSGRIAVGAAVDGQLSTQGVWVKDAVREPSLTGAACGRTGATGVWRGAPDRRGGRLPPGSGARGGTRRAHQPTTEAARGHLAPVQGPRACAGTT